MNKYYPTDQNYCTDWLCFYVCVCVYDLHVRHNLLPFGPHPPDLLPKSYPAICKCPVLVIIIYMVIKKGTHSYI